MPLIEYRLCEKFGWTLDELYEQPFDKVWDFISIMNIEGQLKKREMESLKNG